MSEEIQNFNIEGYIQAVAQNGTLIVSQKDNSQKLYLYEPTQQSVNFLQVSLNFYPVIEHYYLEEPYHTFKYIQTRIIDNSAYIYVVEKSSKKKVAQILVHLPLNETSPIISYFEHDKKIQEIQMHPTRNELVLLEKYAFHLLITDYTIPITLTNSGSLDESKLVITEIDGSVYYYGFFLERKLGQHLQIIKVKQNSFGSSYTQVGNKYINFDSSLQFSQTPLLRFDYSAQDNIFGLTLELQEHFWFFYWYTYKTYFFDKDLKTLADQSQMFDDYQFHMFSQRQNYLSIISPYSTCFLQYELQDNSLELRKSTKECYDDYSFTRVAQSQDEEFHPIIHFSQGYISIFQTDLQTVNASISYVDQFSVKKPNYIITKNYNNDLSFHSLTSIYDNGVNPEGPGSEQAANDESFSLGIFFGITVGIFLLFVVIVYICYKLKQGREHAQVNEANVIQVQSFTMHNITDKRIQQHYESSRQNPCSICLDYECRCYLPCGHYFHELCLSAWLRKNKNCPVCRRPTDPRMIRFFR